AFRVTTRTVHEYFLFQLCSRTLSCRFSVAGSQLSLVQVRRARAAEGSDAVGKLLHRGDALDGHMGCAGVASRCHRLQRRTTETVVPNIDMDPIGRDDETVRESVLKRG